MFALLFLVPILPLLLTSRLAFGAKCGVVPSDLIDCARKHGIDRIPSDSEGYGFGFGSIDAVENMCRTKWHLKVYTCAHQTVLSRCAKEKNTQFHERMWKFMFDTTRYARAAMYFCKSHNLKLFRMHRFACFAPLEDGVEVCSRKYAQTLSATTSRLATTSPTNMTNEASYADYMQQEITQAYCVGTSEKIACVTQTLQQLCTLDAIALIRNYYRETLPENCVQPTEFAKRNRSRLLPTKRATSLKLSPSRPHQGDRPKVIHSQLGQSSSSIPLQPLLYTFISRLDKLTQSNDMYYLITLTFLQLHLLRL
ncbi:hypothetical protein FBUS_04541 [Fasciolopsis buskii]|uniref:Uncharacterized protein n=1 Tax=Fasciolopsis buskii TaxID=27845 RepID=A0A8E0RP19_9TREM|nr:hypothetical protein FBUS_04541 [Fasciolopsis buski]